MAVNGHSDPSLAVEKGAPVSTNTQGGNYGQGHGGHQLSSRAVTPGGHPLDTTQPGWTTSHRRLANPAPLGLLSFATTTLLLSFFNVKARHVAEPNLILGLAFAYGGLCQLLAGMWEFAAGNTFGATAFSSYGGFWISFAFIFLPSSGILDAYTAAGVNPGDLDSALGLYLAGWFIFTFIMLIASLRSSVGLVLLFFFLDLTFLLLCASYFVADVAKAAKVTTAGGAFGIVTAAIAFYVGAAGLLTPDTAFFVLPIGDLSKRD